MPYYYYFFKRNIGYLSYLIVIFSPQICEGSDKGRFISAKQKKSYFLISTPVFNSRSFSDNASYIDYLLNQSDSFIYTDYYKSLGFARKAYVKAMEHNNPEKKAEAYLYIAKSLLCLGRYEECFIYIEKGMAMEPVKNNIRLNALFRELKVFCYLRTNLLNNQLKECQAILALIVSDKDLQSRLLRSNIEALLGNYYISKNDYKKAHYYTDRSIKDIEEISEKKYFSSKRIYWHKAYIYLYKSNLYLKEDKLELSYHYLEKAYRQIKRERHIYIAPFLEAYGDYYYKNKMYIKAIHFYMEALESKKKFKRRISNLNFKIAQAYKFCGRYVEKEKYLDIYMAHRFSEDKKDVIIVSSIVEEVLRECEQHEIKHKYVKKQISIFIGVISLIILFLLIYIYLEIKIRRSKLIHKNESLLFKKEKEIVDRKVKIEGLQKKLNESFTEVVEMAKKNSPLFWPRFREVYPEFYEKMLVANPKIRTSELTFCAYLYLGFTTKEIADYTFVTIRGVETRRNRLRKKYKIPSDMDFSVWIKSLGNRPIQ